MKLLPKNPDKTRDIASVLSRGVVWLSTSEVANLLGLKNRDSVREACHERQGSYRGGVYVFRKSGRNYEIALHSLPKSAQNQYARNHLATIKSQASTSLVQGETISSQTPSHSLTISTSNFIIYNDLFSEYAQKSDTIKATANKRLKVMDDYFELLKTNISKGQVEQLIFERHQNISRATLYRWISQVKDHPREYWLAMLVPQNDGKKRLEIPGVAWDFFIANYLSQAQPAAAVIYRKTIKAAKTNAWGPLPSLKTFERRVKEIDEDILILGRKGETALKESLPHAKQDYTKRNVNDTWEADGRKCDVWVKMDNIEKPVRLWLVVMRELRSRMIIGFKLGVSNDAALVSAALIDAFRRTGTRPKNFHFDNGTEYSNNLLTGGQKSSVRQISENNHAIGALTRMGIKVTWATPKHGAAKAIESHWNTFAENVDRTFGLAYVGNNASSRPEDCDPRHAVPYELFEKATLEHIVAFCNGENGPHRGQGMNGKSPYEVYIELLNPNELRPVTDFEIASIRPIYTRTLSSQLTFSIKIEGYGVLEYEPIGHSQLKRYLKYQVLLDPHNYNNNALIYNGSIPIGEAKIKHAIDYSVVQAENFPPAVRKHHIKQAKAELKAINEANSITLNTIYPDTSNLLNGVTQGKLLHQKPIKPEAKESTVKTLENGDVINNITGKLTKARPIDVEFVPNIQQTSINEELEKKRRDFAYSKAKSDEDKRKIDEERFNAEKEKARPENALLNKTELIHTYLRNDTK